MGAIPILQKLDFWKTWLLETENCIIGKVRVSSDKKTTPLKANMTVSYPLNWLLSKDLIEFGTLLLGYVSILFGLHPVFSSHIWNSHREVDLGPKCFLFFWALFLWQTCYLLHILLTLSSVCYSLFATMCAKYFSRWVCFRCEDLQ